MEVIYQRAICEQIIEAQVKADARRRVIDKIVLTKDEWRRFAKEVWELLGVQILIDVPVMYSGICVVREGGTKG